ncbi:MAG: YceD family protein [Alphaproteobacteria bacterium]
MAKGLESGAEFSRMVDCASLGRSIQRHEIEADESERMALAARLGLLSLDEMKAEVVLARTPDGSVRMKAKFKARLVQSCIVALQPVPQELGEDFELFFKEDAGLDGIGVLEVTIEDELWPEPLDQGRIDIGEVVSQQLALVLDPYPRALGAVFEASAEPVNRAEARKPLAEIGKLLLSGYQEDER